MATRKNTIKVPINFGGSGTIPDAVLTTIGTPTIYIPENSVTNTVVFTSVSLFVFAQDMSTATGGTLTQCRFSCTLSGASSFTITELDDIAHSGENWGGYFGPWDFTSYFNSNFGVVTSKSCQVDVYFDINTGTGTTVNQVNGFFLITYEYDDSELSRIKTIPICLESNQGAMSTVANTTFGTIPQLLSSGGWLNGYNTPTIRHIWVELAGSTGVNGATGTLRVNWGFNGVGGGGLSDNKINGLVTDTFWSMQIDLSSLDLSITNTIDLWSTVASKFHCITVTIFVTYEFVVSGSTRVLNTAHIPVEYDSPLSGTTSAVAHRFNRSVLIPEPGVITQRSIGLKLTWNSQAGTAIQIRAGLQASFKAYTTAASVVAGMFCTQHLLDTNSSSGEALTLVRGENEIEIDLYRSSGTAYNISGMIYILYESDISDQGIDNHTSVNYELVRQIDLVQTGVVDTNSSFQIPEANYWIQSLGFEIYYWISTSINATGFYAKVLAGEGDEGGYRQLYRDSYLSDAEMSFSIWSVRARDEFMRHPLDPDTNRLNSSVARDIRITTLVSFKYGFQWVVTKHSITYTISGEITNSDGGIVNIEVRKVSDDSLYVRSSRTGDGSYSVIVYDDVAQYYAVAYESNTKKGRSLNGVPDTNFNIDLAPSGGGSIGGRILII